MEEIWKDVVGYEGYYQISNFGRVKSVKRVIEDSWGRTATLKEKIIKPSKIRKGYFIISLYKNAVYKKILVHRLVATAFISNIEGKKEVNHINGIKDDNRLLNLEWSTASENQKHAFKNGLNMAKRGQNVVISKLSNIDAYNIKFNLGFLSLQKTADIYGVSKSCIEKIRNNRSWAYLEK